MNWKHTVNIKVTARDLEGNVIDVQKFHNLIVTVGFNMTRDGWKGDVADSEIKVIGLGDDSTAPVIADSTLGNEVFRKLLASKTASADAELTSIGYIAPAEAVGLIEEIGWFAGAAADAGTPNSGILVSRVLYNRTKTGLESLQIERVDSLVEV